MTTGGSQLDRVAQQPDPSLMVQARDGGSRRLWTRGACGLHEQPTRGGVDQPAEVARVLAEMAELRDNQAVSTDKCAGMLCDGRDREQF